MSFERGVDFNCNYSVDMNSSRDETFQDDILIALDREVLGYVEDGVLSYIECE